MNTDVLANHGALPETLTRHFWKSKTNPSLKTIAGGDFFLLSITNIENAHYAVAHSRYCFAEKCQSFSDINKYFIKLATAVPHLTKTANDAKKTLPPIIREFIKQHSNESRLVSSWKTCIEDLNHFAKLTFDFNAACFKDQNKILKQYEIFYENIRVRALEGINDFLETSASFIKNNCDRRLEELFLHATAALKTIEYVTTAVIPGKPASTASGTIVQQELLRSVKGIKFEPILRTLKKYQKSERSAWFEFLVAMQRKDPDMTLLQLVDETLREGQPDINYLTEYRRCIDTFLGRLEKINTSLNFLYAKTGS